jgi:tripartite-type tricarboxylate transporter receptor subunit TctC
MPSLRMIAALAVLAATLPATAQNWPTRPVTMLLPFAAGGAGDILGRIFASRLSELLGQPVIFENVGGAKGMTGASRVAKAASDGYQFLLGSCREPDVLPQSAVQRRDRLHSRRADRRGPDHTGGA